MFLQLPGWASFLLSFGFACAFVGSLYVWPKSSTLDRNDPIQVKRRFMSIGTVSILSPFLLFLFDDSSREGPPLPVWIGFRGRGFGLALILPLIVTMTLFLGPIVLYFMENSMRDLRRDISSYLNHTSVLLPLRDLVVAPFCEELVFRALICTSLIAGGFGFTATVFISPTLFGIAHFHHLIGLVRSEGYSFAEAAKRCLFQLFYTTLFGSYASFIYITTGQFVAPFLCHAFCNMMGFPDFSWAVDQAHPQFKNKTLIWIIFVTGIALFTTLLATNWLTSPDIYDSFIYSRIEKNSTS